MNKALFFAMAVFFLLIVPPTFAQLSCTVRNNSCQAGEINALQMSSTSNGHASIDDTYDFKVCCSGTTDLGTDCISGTVFLRLSNSTNAHVEQADQANYTIEACLSSATETISCEYYDTDCPAGSTCLATISSETNAHIADCDGTNDYLIKVCCTFGALPLPGEKPSITNVTATNAQVGGNTTVSVEVENPNADTTISLRFYEATSGDELPSLGQSGISIATGQHQGSYGPFDESGTYMILASIEQPDCAICEKSAFFAVIRPLRSMVPEMSIFLVVIIGFFVLWVVKAKTKVINR